MINNKIYNSHQSQLPRAARYDPEGAHLSSLAQRVPQAQIAKEPAPYPVLGPRGFFA